MRTHASRKERAEKIIAGYRAGKSLRTLARRFRLTYERVRQIVRGIDPNARLR